MLKFAGSARSFRGRASLALGMAAVVAAPACGGKVTVDTGVVDDAGSAGTGGTTGGGGANEQRL
jgi:hypothetical protein